MIYDVFNNFSGDVSYVSNASDPAINIDAIAQATGAELQRDSNNVKQAEDNFLSLRKTVDSLTGLPFDNDTQKQTLDKLKQKYDVTEEFIDQISDVEDLQNPTLIKRMANSYTSMLKDPMYVNMFRTQKNWQNFYDKIPDVYAENSQLGSLAMQHYNDYVSGNLDANEAGKEQQANIKSFMPLDVDKTMKDTFDVLDREIELVENENSPDGFIYIDKVSKVPLEKEEVRRRADFLVDKLMNNEQFNNNLSSIIALNDPDSNYDNEEIKRQYVDELFNEWAAGKVVDTIMRNEPKSGSTGSGSGKKSSIFGDTKEERRAQLEIDRLSNSYPKADFYVDPLSILDYANADNRAQDYNEETGEVVLRYWNEGDSGYVAGDPNLTTPGPNNFKEIRIPDGEKRRAKTEKERFNERYLPGVDMGQRSLEADGLIGDYSIGAEVYAPGTDYQQYSDTIRIASETNQAGAQELIGMIDDANSIEQLEYLDYARQEAERVGYPKNSLFNYVLNNPENYTAIYNFAHSPEVQEAYFRDHLLPSYEAQDPGSDRYSLEERYYIIHHDGNASAISSNKYVPGKDIYDEIHKNGFSMEAHEQAKKNLVSKAPSRSHGDAQRSLYMIEYLKRQKGMTDIGEIFKYLENNNPDQPYTNNPLSSAVGNYQVIMSIHIDKLKKLYPQLDVGNFVYGNPGTSVETPPEEEATMDELIEGTTQDSLNRENESGGDIYDRLMKNNN
jgi:hypothetical protein